MTLNHRRSKGHFESPGVQHCVTCLCNSWKLLMNSKSLKYTHLHIFTSRPIIKKCLQHEDNQELLMSSIQKKVDYWLPSFFTFSLQALQAIVKNYPNLPNPTKAIHHKKHLGLTKSGPSVGAKALMACWHSSLERVGTFMCSKLLRQEVASSAEPWGPAKGGGGVFCAGKHGNWWCWYRRAT